MKSLFAAVAALGAFAAVPSLAAPAAAPATKPATTTTHKTTHAAHPASAGEAPSPDEAVRVANYYFGGKDAGPLLVKTVACLKVDESADSPTKNQCVQPVNGPVPKGADVIAWTQWLVPVDGKYTDVSIQFVVDGSVHETREIDSLNEGLRMYVWRAATMSKSGKWTVKVVRAGKDLASVDVTVQ
ncbi:MAG TPA: hypothetical protein VMV18_12835 [bacterium]|nr:hypothetical protein [bacterium]